MNVYKKASIIFFSALLMIVSGCSSTANKDGEGADGAIGGGGGGGAANNGPQIGTYSDSQGGPYVANGYGGNSSSAMNDGSAALFSKNLIYFNYDSSEVMPEYVPVVESHAKSLVSNPRKNVVLEGHTDERGSSEYNVALGEKRAKAVADMMRLQGVLDNQIQIVSFGEEKPLASGHDESSWSQNRRVEIAYPGQ